MFNVIKKIKNSLTRVLKWQIKESDHSRLETPLRPHSESSAGGHGWGWGPERVRDRHILTHLHIDMQQQHKTHIHNNGGHTYIHTHTQTSFIHTQDFCDYGEIVYQVL